MQAMLSVFAGLRQRSMENKMESLAVTTKVGFGMLNVGNTKGYELIAAGELETFKIGNATRITTKSIRAYVERQLASHKEAA